MGTCTSTARHRQKQQHQQYNRIATKNFIDLDIKPPPPLPPLPLNAFPKQKLQHSDSLYADVDILSPSLTKSIFHQTDTNSLIQLYSSNTNNNNNNSEIVNWMSSSTTSVTHIPPRIPVPKTRLPVYHSSQSQQATVVLRPKGVPSTIIPINPKGANRPMSMTNRPPPPVTMQTRFGFIPRPPVPGLQQPHRASTLASRSRSISPTSTISANSSSSSSLVSQRSTKGQTISKTTPNQSVPTSSPSSSTANNTSKSKLLTSPRARDSSIPRSTVKSTVQSPTAASQMRSRTPSRSSSGASPSSSVASPPSSTIPPSSSSSSSNTTSTLKSDVNIIRDRYKAQTRMNFFTRHTPISTANGSPIASSNKPPEQPSMTNKEKKQASPKPSSINKPNNNLKTKTPPQISSSRGDSAYESVTFPSNQTPSAHLSQSNRHRQRAISMLSTGSAISDVLNQDALLEDDNCSLKSDDLMCDYDDTLTIDSTSRNDRTDSCSSASFSIESNKKHTTTIIPVTPTKPNILHHPPNSKENRSTPITANDKTNGSLRESLDELNRLSNRMDNGIDNEHNRRLVTRSVSLKPPTTYLPPLEDAEQITMDIESYRQVMKDVMVVKTILHQLDRLLKHSDGANMTDSMIGSFHEFHESVYSSRRYSTTTGIDANVRSTIDENSSYDDLLKEILTLRKEKEQDKQTIKLLQEQMYKYSSQTNGS